MGKEQPASFYDNVYLRGYNDKRYELLYQIAIDMIFRDCEVNKYNILDVGCGIGSFAMRLFDKKTFMNYGVRNSDVTYQGFDFSEVGIRLCMLNVPELRNQFFVGNVYDKQAYLGDYNIAVILEVLEHVNDKKVLKRIKKGAYVVGSVPTYNYVAHVRTYDEETIKKRFSELLDLKYLQVIERADTKKPLCYVFCAIKK